MKKNEAITGFVGKNAFGMPAAESLPLARG